MDDVAPEKRKIEGRSPLCPFIPLDKAIARLEQFEQRSRGYPINVVAAGQAWNLGAKSSGTLQTIGALKQFGLLQDAGGSGNLRTLKATELGKKLLRNPPASVRQDLIKQAALSSKLIKEYWGEWGTNPPHDEDGVWHLREKVGFTGDAARRFLAVYEATIRFAGLAKSDIVADEDGSEALNEDDSDHGGKNRPQPIAVGDLVQWVSQGVLQFPTPRRVLGIVSDPVHGPFADVEGYVGKLPLEQLELVTKMNEVDQQNGVKDVRPPSVLPTPANPKPLIQRAFLPLPTGGHVAVEYPTDIDEDSLQDMAAHLATIIRQATRAARKNPQGKSGSGRAAANAVFKQLVDASEFNSETEDA